MPAKARLSTLASTALERVPSPPGTTVAIQSDRLFDQPAIVRFGSVPFALSTGMISSTAGPGAVADARLLLRVLPSRADGIGAEAGAGAGAGAK